MRHNLSGYAAFLKGAVNMSEFLVSFLNLFFVPVICLHIHRRTVIRVPLNGGELFLRYCIFAVLNLPLTRVFIMLIEKIVGSQIAISSAYYSIAAIVSAVLLPWGVALIRKYVHVRFEVKKHEKE